MDKWYTASKPESDVVLSCRVRLARNIKGYPFTGRMSNFQKKAFIRQITSAFSESEYLCDAAFTFIDMASLDDISAAALVEKCVVAPEFIWNRENKFLFLSKDESVAIELGGEEHICISVTLGGISLSEAYSLADSLDNIISEMFPISFDEQLGYLTASPTELGTAMQASLVLHLPALKESGEISQAVESVSKIGFTLKNAFGEDYDNPLAQFRLSNRVSLGITEKSAIDNLNAIALQIMGKERAARELLDRLDIEDSALRALAILKSAKLIKASELGELLSAVRLGISLGVISEHTLPQITELQIMLRDNIILMKEGCSTAQIEQERARLIKELLN